MSELNLAMVKYIARDFAEYQELVGDPVVMRYIAADGLTAVQARAKFDAILNVNAAEAQLGYFKVLNAAGLYIGEAKLERYKEDLTMLEIGYILKQDYWGQGYGTAICRLLLEKASASYPTMDIIGLIDPGNSASKHLLTKFSFVSIFVGIVDELPTEKLILTKNKSV